MKNVKRLLILVMICFIWLTATAQPRPGIKGGLNQASLSNYAGDKLTSFHAGIFVHVPIDMNWRVQPELLYSGEGQHYLVYDLEGAIVNKNTIALRYIQLPLVVQYFPIPSFYVETGPQLGVLLGAYNRFSEDAHMNLKRSFSSTQFGWNLGAGVFFNPQIGIYGRYFFGLTDVTPFNPVENRSHSAQFGLAYRLKQKRKTVISVPGN